MKIASNGLQNASQNYSKSGPDPKRISPKIDSKQNSKNIGKKTADDAPRLSKLLPNDTEIPPKIDPGPHLDPRGARMVAYGLLS